jgi:hypothetical protein
MTSLKVRLLGTAAFVSLALAMLGVMTTHASGVKTVAMTDDCDPATFNDPVNGVGPGTCVGDGETTFQAFIAELQQNRTADDWENDPDDLDVGSGQAVRARNEGGEFHTFTQVAKFGGGFVPPLNALSGNATVAPECVTPARVGPTFVPPGGVSSPQTLSNGQHLFQCCIHPWMRTVVKVGKDD